MNKSKSNKNIKNKKRYDLFTIFFVSGSILIFFIFITSLVWFKNTLFEVKDEISLEILLNEQKKQNLVRPSSDPFIFSEINDKKITKPILSKNDPSLGSFSNKIKLFYFSNYDCSFCFTQEENIKNIYEKYKDYLVITRKDYPDFLSVNNFSYQASRAARCAQEQDNFWDYSKLIYEEKDKFDNLADNLFLDLAEKLELNINSFVNCMNKNNVDSLILDNIKEAEDLGIMAVPYIYINDRDFIGNIGVNELESIIKLEINKID